MTGIELALAGLRQRPTAPIALKQPLEVDQLPTPALVLDLPTLDRNIAKMSGHLQRHGKAIRPHSKTHKCPLIAQRQLAVGALGICAAKPSEAAAMIHGGIKQILLTSPVVTESKAQLIASLLAPEVDLMMVVDSMPGLDILARHLSPEHRIGLLVDVDLSMGRTGVRELDDILGLVEQISADPRFRFAGIQHYAGHLMHLSDYDKRREKSLTAWERLDDIFRALDERGFVPAIVTGGGTGTFDIDIDVGRLTELQVGSYVFMDEEYRALGSARGERFVDFDVSLTVACSTISRPQQPTITVDGGYKAFASDSVAPICVQMPDLRYHFAGDEHGVLVLGDGERAVDLGQVIEFITPHCDPTVNLHELYWVREADGMVHSCWPITARGCSW
tara:strand:- start:4961 stop:6130 length:1170 start_codon:yes stop_codon:yes gene_type:complete